MSEPDERAEGGGLAAFLAGLVIVFLILKWLAGAADKSK